MAIRKLTTETMILLSKLSRHLILIRVCQKEELQHEKLISVFVNIICLQFWGSKVYRCRFIGCKISVKSGAFTRLKM